MTYAMKMDSDKEKRLSSQGSRTPSGPAQGDTVPVFPASGEHCAPESHDGLSTVLSTSTVDEFVIAEENAGITDPEISIIHFSPGGLELTSVASEGSISQTSGKEATKRKRIEAVRRKTDPFPTSSNMARGGSGPSSYKERKMLSGLKDNTTDMELSTRDISPSPSTSFKYSDMDIEMTDDDRPLSERSVGMITSSRRCSTDSIVCAQAGKNVNAKTNLAKTDLNNIDLTKPTDRQIIQRTGSLESIYNIRKRGRPITTGDYVDLAKAKQALLEVEREALDFRVEREVTSMLTGAVAAISDRSQDAGLKSVSTADLSSTVEKTLDTITGVAEKSKNLKGTMIKTLKKAVAAIRVSANELCIRSYESGSAQGRNNPNSTAELESNLKKAEKRIEDLVSEVQFLKKELLSKETPKGQRKTHPGKRKICEDLDTSVADTDTQEQKDRNLLDKLVAKLEGKMIYIMEKNMDSFRKELDEKYSTWNLPERISSPVVEEDDHLFRRPEPPSWTPIGSAASLGLPQSGRRKGKVKVTEDIRIKEPNKRNDKNKSDSKKNVKSKKEDKSIERDSSDTTQRRYTGTGDDADADSDSCWTKVENKRRSKLGIPKTDTLNTRVQSNRSITRTRSKVVAASKNKSEKSTPRSLYKKLPSTEAITVICPKDYYEEFFDEAIQKIDLSELGINGLSQRGTRSGAMSLQISGPDNKAKADKLANRLTELAARKEGVKITRPKIWSEVIITGLNSLTSPENVITAISSAGECPKEEVKVGTVRINPFNRRGSLWAKGPATAINKIIKSDNFRIGWINAKIIPLDSRPLQCFKCHAGGHVIAECTSNTDRSNQCYRCGETGHLARNCAAEPKCSICADNSLSHSHRTGAKQCQMVRGKNRSPKQRVPDPIMQDKTVNKTRIEEKSNTKSMQKLKQLEKATSKIVDGISPVIELSQIPPPEDLSEMMDYSTAKITRPAPLSSSGSEDSPAQKRKKDECSEPSNIPDEVNEGETANEA